MIPKEEGVALTHRCWSPVERIAATNQIKPTSEAIRDTINAYLSRIEDTDTYNQHSHRTLVTCPN